MEVPTPRSLQEYQPLTFDKLTDSRIYREILEKLSILLIKQFTNTMFILFPPVF